MLEVLSEAGVDTIFGLPGGPIAPLNDALLDRPGMSHFTSKHENHAMFAAAGYARATGELGVVLITSGPGILNGICGLASAHCEHIPLLVLVGEVPRKLHGMGALQDGSAHNLDIRHVVSTICKAVVEVPNGRGAATALRGAIRTARTGRPGPVVVKVPLDVLATRCSFPSIVANGKRRRGSNLDLTRVVDAIARSQSGAIFVGSGARSGRGPDLLKALAERLGWPVLTTPKAKGLFPESHPLSLGVFGLGGHPTGAEYLSTGVETVLTLGTSLGDISTNGWSEALIPTSSFIQVDIDPQRISMNYDVSIFVQARVDDFLASLVEFILPREVRIDLGRHPRRHLNLVDGVDGNGNGPSGLISPARAIVEIQQACPEDTIFAIDSGGHNLYAIHFLELDRPDAFLLQTGLAAMGSGIGGGIGVSFAKDDRQVAIICGDGGFVMAGSEIATAVEAGRTPWFFVFNDHRLGMVEQGLTRVYGRTLEFGLGQVDVRGFAASLGAYAVTVDSPGQLAEAAKRFPKDRVVVVDVRIDPAVQMPSNQRAKDFNAVISGGAKR